MASKKGVLSALGKADGSGYSLTESVMNWKEKAIDLSTIRQVLEFPLNIHANTYTVDSTKIEVNKNAIEVWHA